MSKHPLAPAFTKIERAQAHIGDLNAAIRAFFNQRPYRLAPQLDENGENEIWSIAVNPIPDAIECIAADAVHNLRTPLDKMLSAGWRADNIHMGEAQASRIKFPFVDHANGLENALAKLEKHLTPPVIEFLRTCEPYKGGNGHTLWAVNQLDNWDKHRALLQPISTGFAQANVASIRVTNGSLWRIGSKRGRHLIPVPEAVPGAWHMHQPDPELRPIFSLRPPLRTGSLEFTSPYDDMEILTASKGAKVQAKVEPSLNVAFSDIEGFEGEPVVKALEAMRQGVEIVLDEFRRAFF